MRDILVRNVTSTDWSSRDCTVTELVRQGEFTTRVVRRCTYRVESQRTLASVDDSVAWAHTLDPLPPRQVFVTKDHDVETGSERVVYKVLGYLYVVWGQVVVCIGYRHLLSMYVEACQAGSDESS